MRAGSIKIGAVLYWDSSKTWELSISDAPAHRVTVKGPMGRYTRAVGGHQIVRARQGTGRLGVWGATPDGQEHIIPLAQLRGIHADVLAGTVGHIHLTDTQHYLVQLLAHDGLLQRNAQSARNYWVRHGHVGRIPVRTDTVKVLERHGFVEKSNVERPHWWTDYDYVFTAAGRQWYERNPRKEGTRL